MGDSERTNGIRNQVGFAREPPVQRLFAGSDAFGDIVEPEITETALRQQCQGRGPNAFGEVRIECAGGRHR